MAPIDLHFKKDLSACSVNCGGARVEPERKSGIYEVSCGFQEKDDGGLDKRGRCTNCQKQ